jgi:hypothetical protein
MVVNTLLERDELLRSAATRLFLVVSLLPSREGKFDKGP